jgi:hypothetical protein
MPSPHPLFVQGVDLFNREEFFDAHEVVEDLWQEFAGPERDFLKGFIQASVALEHHRRGNLKGLRSVGGTSSALLRRYTPSTFGFDVEALLRDLESFLDATARGETPSYPRARWAAAAAPEDPIGGRDDPSPRGEKEQP